MMFDSEKFIDCIRVNPSIWKTGSKGYIDKDIRNECWNRVGSMMYANWNEKIHEEREEKVKDLKCKWRHIRDNYMKYLNQSLITKKKRKYIYADMLTFLKPSVKRRRRNQNVLDPLDNTNNHNKELLEETESKLFSSEEIYISTEPVQIFPNTTEKTRLDEEFRSTCSTSTQTEQRLSVEVSSVEDISDPEKSFMLSLLPDYKQLTYEQKIDFRIYALQFFKNISQTRGCVSI